MLPRLECIVEAGGAEGFGLCFDFVPVDASGERSGITRIVGSDNEATRGCCPARPESRLRLPDERRDAMVRVPMRRLARGDGEPSRIETVGGELRR